MATTTQMRMRRRSFKRLLWMTRRRKGVLRRVWKAKVKGVSTLVGLIQVKTQVRRMSITPRHRCSIIYVYSIEHNICIEHTSPLPWSS